MITRLARIRMIVTAISLGLGLGAIVVRAHRLQILRHNEFRTMADDQYLAEVRLPARRGTIVDRNGKVLALSVQVDSVWANPREIGPRARPVARGLAEILGTRTEPIEKKLRERRYFTWIKRRATAEEASRVRAGAFPGVYTLKESRRVYPSGALAASLLGFVGADDAGLEGIERSQDKLLRGETDRAPALRDAHGREIFPLGIPDSAIRRGHDLVLTLDERIQYLADQAISDAIRTHQAKAGWAIVLDARTSEILALSSFPTYNPNQPERGHADQRRNRALSDVFEPGSTAKVFSFAAALEAHVVDPSERFFCENGRLRVGGHTIRDAHPQGWLDLTQVLTKSSNIGTAKIARRMGREALYRMLTRFGFGQETGVELPGEVGGTVHSPAVWSEVGLANIAFGQGFSVTALQLAQALGAIANNGMLTAPRVVRRITDGQGRNVPLPRPKSTRILDSDVTRQLRDMLVAATESGGTGTRAAIPGFRVAGKTGTAQKVDGMGGGYSDDRWIASFIGFAPATAPRLVAVVVIDEPQGELHYGGLIAAPAFRAMVEPALKYLGVPASEPIAAVKTEDAALAVSVPEGAATTAAEPALPGALQIPDFTGMSMPEALQAAQRTGVSVELIGTGRATSQSPAPGPASIDTRVRLQFEPG